MLEHLTTEARNPASEQIDTLSALEIVRLMNRGPGREKTRLAPVFHDLAERLKRHVESAGMTSPS